MYGPDVPEVLDERLDPVGVGEVDEGDVEHELRHGEEVGRGQLGEEGGLPLGVARRLQPVGRHPLRLHDAALLPLPQVQRHPQGNLAGTVERK